MRKRRALRIMARAPGQAPLLFGFMLLCSLFPLSALASIHHSLEVTVHAQEGEIEVVDRLSLEGPRRFTLGATLDPQVEGGRLQPLGEQMPGMADYLLTPHGEGPVTLRYRGPVHSERTDIFAMPSAVVDSEGVFLDASSAWYPLFRTSGLTFDLTVSLPDGWVLVGQGRTGDAGDGRQRISVGTPQEDIYLLAGPYVDYQRGHNDRSLAVYLLQKDAALAEAYLDAIAGYLDFYEALIGPYAYDQFAVVENRWQTGYGMPGFTLLGSRVIRLPFLLKTSLPHEILHNWFGNGVYIDPADGNWSEGLTAYLADYMISEAAGEGAEARQRLLARYTDFASQGRDFPVTAFRSRHDDASQAVGYDKVQLLLHMLRQQIGDEAFIAGVRRFYQRFLFSRAGFKDLLNAFSGADFDAEAFFAAWIARPGAPRVELAGVQRSRTADGYRLEWRLVQTRQAEPYELLVPVYITLEGEPHARREVVRLDGPEHSYALDLDKRPLRIDIDPAFELFRALNPLERPSALGRLFGAERQWLVIPSAAPPDVQAAWRELAAGWQERYGNVRQVSDVQLGLIPEAGALWLFGWDNQGLQTLGGRFTGQDQALDAKALRIAGQVYGRGDHAGVLLDPDNARAPLGFIGAEDATAIRRLAGKLTHYGSFGRMVFTLPSLENVRRDRLEVEHSPLSESFDEPGPELRLPPVTALAARAGVALPD